jgi:hypothetical protein
MVIDIEPEVMPIMEVKVSKLKVLLLYIVYPLAMGTYFRRALERRDDVDLKVAGVYTGAWIPWMGGMELPPKYAKPIDIPLPFTPNVGEVNYDLVKAQLGDWKPDIIINVDAGLHWKYKPADGMVVTVGTDPHVLNDFYDTPRKYSDLFFNMQKVYSRGADFYLPYAYDPLVHYPSDNIYRYKNWITDPKIIEKDTDAVLIGMPYEHRVQWVAALRAKDVSVLFENGPVFDEYREMNNRARIGLNWSSLDDLNARAYELAAMKLAPVMNVVTDLEVSGIECATFTTLPEAVEAVMFLKENDHAQTELAELAYRSVQGETYDKRVNTILQMAGFVA